MISILNIEPDGFSKEATEILSSIGRIDSGPFTRKELLKKLDFYDVLIVRLAHKIDREIIDVAKKLKVVSSATTGLNHIDVHYANKEGIEVLSLRGEIEFLETIHATAEHTWALILSLIRKIPQAYSSVLDGKWNRDAFKGRELDGATLGIVGLGRIGKKIANYGISFGMNVIAYTEGFYDNVYGVVRVDSLTELIKQSDIISIHVPFDSTTSKMFGKKEFREVKRGAIIVNTSRGEIIDETELLNAIKDGNLSGAALDVLEDELALNQKNRKALVEFAKKDNRVLITPHIGGATFESMEKTEIFMANKVVNYFKERI